MRRVIIVRLDIITKLKATRRGGAPLSQIIINPSGQATRRHPNVVGDANCNGECRGSDITYLVAALKGSESAKPNCICTDLNHSHIAFWVSAEYNGDCLIMGSDVTYAVRYFKGLGPAPEPCSSFNPNCP